MKRRPKVLVILNVILAQLLAVFGSVLAASFPSLPVYMIWIGGATVVGAAIVVSVMLALAEAKQDEQPAQQKSLQSKQQSHAAEKAAPTSLQTNGTTYRSIQKKAEVKSPNNTLPRNTTPAPVAEDSQPTVERPMLLCLAIDVSDSMKQPILDHTGKTIQRWTSVSNAIEHFVHLGIAWVKDPDTQRVLPLYHLMAYAFGFKEAMYGFGVRKTPGGAVRDLLAHPSLTSLPSVSELSEHWNDYKDHLFTMREYTGDLFGLTPMCQALTTIRDRIREECKQKAFICPILLLIISDGLADDGDPLPISEELHSMGVMILCCYLADRDVLASKQLYDTEESSWSSGAKFLFRCASVLHKDNYVSQAMFNSLSDHGWRPHEGVRLFAQVNQTDALDSFLKVLLSGSSNERRPSCLGTPPSVKMII